MQIRHKSFFHKSLKDATSQGTLVVNVVTLERELRQGKIIRSYS